ncbi:hypothetical protein MED121_12930 [Marinomonas sp. MED121]|uniref:hypothetical protein n=1 Tax=Marinomonas sp. MED121 TaxID=314277 RepID=UPI000069000A|nr:hypothetical protein [Marinomonas sp. MED121]EAQ66832.1 hypothetical protein MED121_12930 [Marinomonas sp. MED121]
MNDELNEKRVERDFSRRSAEEQQDFLSQTWCNTCMEVDLGMKNPKEYESESRVWIEGECVKCGQITITEIVEED